MEIYCLEVSLAFEYLVISVKTTVREQKCWLLGLLKFALHP